MARHLPPLLMLLAWCWTLAVWLISVFATADWHWLIPLHAGVPMIGLLLGSTPSRFRWMTGGIGLLFLGAWLGTGLALPPSLRWAWLHDQESVWQCLAFAGIPCGVLALWLRHIAMPASLSRERAARLGGWTFFFLTVAVSVRCLAFADPPRNWLMGLTVIGCAAFWIPAWAWRQS